MHVNVSRGGFFTVFDKVHYVDPRTLKPIIITRDAPSVTKNLKLRNQRTTHLNIADDTDDQNRVWMIVRYMKNCSKDDAKSANKFTLRGGERIKLGRVIFTVKELVND